VVIATFEFSGEMLLNRGIYDCPVPIGGEILGITSIEKDGNKLPALVLRFEPAEPPQWEVHVICTPYDGNRSLKSTEIYDKHKSL
jgi:hypothetical protein